jgi:uncharacterized protein
MPSILVIALSARMYAEALHLAGFKVTVIDGFADQETRAFSQIVLRVPIYEKGFDATSLLNAIKALPLKLFSGFLYGSGFEAQPELLNQIACLLPLIGNTPEVVARLKTPKFLFNSLTKVSVRLPEMRSLNDLRTLVFSEGNKAWLKKQVGGAGGVHIQYHTHENNFIAAKDLTDHYYQAFVKGKPISLLFLVDVAGVTAISFNAQFLASTEAMPFRFGGAVSQIRLSKHIKRQLVEIAQQMTSAFNLKGLNSLDVVLQNNDVFVLEINPRLSATFDLQPNKVALILRHLQAFGVDLSDLALQQHIVLTEENVQAQSIDAIAQVVLYADKPLIISSEFVWSNWVKDMPYINGEPLYLQRDAPICTVYAKCNSASLAKKIALQRAKRLKQQLFKYSLVNEALIYSVKPN